MTKTFLLAGGTSGIGRATVELLADEECRLLCACRRPDFLPDLPGVEGTPFEATEPNPDLAEMAEDRNVMSFEFLWPRALLLGCSMLYGTNFPLGRIMNDALPAR